MKTFLRRWRSLFLFLLIPGLSALAPLLVYPAIAARYGSAGFATIAIGQSVGLTAAVICELGWSVVGPQAAASGDDASSLHRASVATKSIALTLGIPVAGFGAYLVTPDNELVAASTAVAFSLTALSPVWLLTGLNRPAVILAVDVVPRMLFNVATAVAIQLGAPLITFAASAAAATLLSLPLAGRLGGFQVLPAARDFRGGLRTIRMQLPLTLGRSVTVVYTSAVTTVVGALAPASVALYAAADRLVRMGLAVLAGVPSRLQSWLGQSSGDSLRARSNQSLLINALLGVVAGVVFFFAAQPAATLIFAGTIAIPPSTLLLTSLVPVAICVSRGMGLSLVAAGRSNAIAVSSAISAGAGGLTGVATIPSLGANGGMLAVVVAEFVGVAVQGMALFADRGTRAKISGTRISSNPSVSPR